MATSEEQIYKANPKSNERIFFLCEDCLWGMTLLGKSHMEEISGKEKMCPLCSQDQLSSFPLRMNDSFTYDYSERTGIEIKFDKI